MVFTNPVAIRNERRLVVPLNVVSRSESFPVAATPSWITFCAEDLDSLDAGAMRSTDPKTRCAVGVSKLIATNQAVMIPTSLKVFSGSNEHTRPEDHGIGN